MNKRSAHHLWRRFRSVKPWYFLLVALICGVIAVFALRQNNETMVRLRAAVYAADEQDKGTQEALAALQAYVTSHMNTNLTTGNTAVYPPIQLKFTYNRLVTAQGNANANANQQIYTDAQKYCEAQNSTDVSGRNRVPCIQAYVSAHTPKQSKPIPDALYKFDFVSPRWSPDLAGWMLVLTVVFAVLFALSFLLSRLAKKHL